MNKVSCMNLILSMIGSLTSKDLWVVCVYKLSPTGLENYKANDVPQEFNCCEAHGPPAMIYSFSFIFIHPSNGT